MAKGRFFWDRIVDENRQEIRSSCLQILDELASLKLNQRTIVDIYKLESEFSVWSQSFAVHKSNQFKSKGINEILKFLALERVISQNNFRKITYQGRNFETALAIKTLATRHKLEFEWKRSLITAYVSKLKFFFVPNFEAAKGLVWLFLFLLSNLPNLFSRAPKLNTTKTRRSVFSNQSKSQASLDSTFNTNETYWGPLPSFLSSKKVSCHAGFILTSPISV